MLGSHLTHIGWEIRGGARARHVSRDQFADFHEWLRRADRVAATAYDSGLLMTLEPTSAVGWHWFGRRA